LQSTVGQPELFYADRRLATFAQSNAIDAVTLAPVMQRLADERHVYFHGFPNTEMGMGHWNADGHAIASDVIAAHLCSPVSEAAY
jgi:hypothetical protein